MNTQKIFVVYKLEDVDCEERRNFVNWYFQRVHDGQMEATLFLFSDEYVNFLNTRFPVFPTFIREISFHHITVLMQCDLSENRILGPFFLHPNARHNITPLLYPLRLCENLFHLTPHTANNSMPSGMRSLFTAC